MNRNDEGKPALHRLNESPKSVKKSVTYKITFSTATIYHHFFFSSYSLHIQIKKKYLKAEKRKKRHQDKIMKVFSTNS